jgi:glycosyltransferase involved in cell wall biosynthesis
MKICLISSYSGHADEGMANIALHFDQELSNRHKVLHVKVTAAAPPSLKSCNRIRDFHPDIIHFVPGPTIRSLVLLKMLKLNNKSAKIVASAPQPRFSSFSQLFISFFKPDVVLCQSYDTEIFFNKYGCRTSFLPNGVDIDRFLPVSDIIKKELRVKFGLHAEKQILLHVGPVRKDRNLAVFNQLNGDNRFQVLIIASTTEAPDEEVLRSLEATGCMVWRNYIENIEKIYTLADWYIFPTIDKLGCIEMPLSVMEAMGANLKVITTRYGVLPKVFLEGDGLFYMDKEDDLRSLLTSGIQENDVNTRQKVMPYSWNEIIRKLEQIYGELLNR